MNKEWGLSGRGSLGASPSFDPKDSFRLVVATKQQEVPEKLGERMAVLKAFQRHEETLKMDVRWTSPRQR